MSRQKTKRHRTVKSPRRSATKPAPQTSDKTKIALLTRELSEALERETATFQVLGIISSSPTDLEPVFETILANATRLCEASYGNLFLCEGDAIRLVAVHGAVPEAYAAVRRRGAVFRLSSRDSSLPAPSGHDRRSTSLTCVRSNPTSTATRWRLRGSNSAGLLTELRDRTTELSESLEQQT